MTTTKGRASRERIVVAAADLMHVHGVAGTSMPMVRERAGVSSSQIYHYFADKDALVGAVVRHQVSAVVGGQSAVLARLDTPTSLRAWRDALVASAGSAAGQHGCPVGSLATELAEGRVEDRAVLVQAFDDWESALRAGLERLADEGRLAPSARPDVLAAALLGVVQGGLLLAQARQDATALAAGLDVVIDAALGGRTQRA